MALPLERVAELEQTALGLHTLKDVGELMHLGRG